jgi:hypothetical protein
MARPRSHRRKRPPRTVADLTWAVVGRHVPGAKLRLWRLRQRWSSVATPRVAAHTWPAALVDQELLLAVQDNQWLHELTYLRQDLLERIRRDAPEAGVASIRMRVGPLAPPAPPPPDPERGEAPGLLSPEPPDDTREVLRGVRDPALAQAAAAARMALGRPRRPR